MKKSIRNKEYSIDEAIAYYILGYEKYKKSKEQNGIGDILKSILEVAQDNLNATEIKGVDNDLLKKVNFSWTLTGDDFISYATCIFYVLINREQIITEEKIVKCFLSEIHIHHPRNTVKEASFILSNLISEYD